MSLHVEHQSSRLKETAVPSVSMESVVDVKSGTYVGDTEQSLSRDALTLLLSHTCDSG